MDIGLNDFITKMDIPKSYRIKDITDKIINPSLKELQNYFQDLQCTVKYERKRGKPVSGYIFTFTPEQPPKPEPKELPEAAEPSEPKKELAQEEMGKLINEFGKELTEKYIERTKMYKCCDYDTIRKWILEDMDKKHTGYSSSKPDKPNQFNQFMQREITDKELDELERKLLARG